MKALIFAAGLGERMRPLTNHTPKPLLPVAGKPLIVWHLEKLAALGVTDVVINTSWLADQFPRTLGDGARWGLRLHYCYEGDTPLETGGGMWNALPLLTHASDPNAAFLLVNGDVWTDMDFAKLPREPRGLAHLVMVDRPPQAARGDFVLAPPSTAVHAERRLLSEGEGDILTYSGIGLYRPQLFDNWCAIIPNPPLANGKPKFPLAPLLRAHMATGSITGEYHAGQWTDVGTPERLALLDAQLTH